MSTLISITPEQSSVPERASGIFATTSALVSGFALLLAIATIF